MELFFKQPVETCIGLVVLLLIMTIVVSVLSARLSITKKKLAHVEKQASLQGKTITDLRHNVSIANDGRTENWELAKLYKTRLQFIADNVDENRLPLVRFIAKDTSSKSIEELLGENEIKRTGMKVC